MRDEANDYVAAERAEHPEKYVDGLVPGHGPDTTWTGNPQPRVWIPTTRRLNSSFGAQARRYPIGYKPTRFELVLDVSVTEPE